MDPPISLLARSWSCPSAAVESTSGVGHWQPMDIDLSLATSHAGAPLHSVHAVPSTPHHLTDSTSHLHYPTPSTHQSTYTSAGSLSGLQHTRPSKRRSADSSFTSIPASPDVFSAPREPMSVVEFASVLTPESVNNLSFQRSSSTSQVAKI